MPHCNQPISDLAFSHLEGIHTLDISYCNQLAISDQTFSFLKGIHDLDMNFCPLPNITGAAFHFLVGASLAPSHEAHALLEGCTLAMIAGAEMAGLISQEQAAFSRVFASDHVAAIPVDDG
jgi:hypothetical protein